MNVLFPFFIYSICVVFVDFSNNKVLKRFIFFSLFCLIIFIGGFRFETGNDWFPYYHFFYDNSTFIDYSNDIRNFEIGYIIINYLVHLFAPYTLFLILVTYFCAKININFIKSFSPYPLLSFYFFFTYYYANIVVVRNTIAIAICLFSIKYILNRDKVRFILVVLIAFLFHRSSLIFLPAYYVYYHNSVKKTFFVLVVLLFTKELILSFLEYFSEFEIVKKVLYYSSSGNDVLSTYSASVTSLLSGILKKILFFPLFLFLIKKEKKYEGMFNLWLFGVLLYMIAVSINFSLQRISSNYLFFEIILLPACIRIPRRKYFKFLLLILFLIYGVMKFEANIVSYPEGVFTPYRFIYEV